MASTSHRQWSILGYYTIFVSYCAMTCQRTLGRTAQPEARHFGLRHILVYALFSSEKILDFGTVAFSFVCDKYCPIIN